MDRLLMAAGAALLIAGSAQAGERPGGHGGGHGGGYRPPPAPCCTPPAPPPGPCCGRSGQTHVNINVSGRATATASATAYGSAHSWSSGTMGGGVIYRGGGYWGGEAYAVGLPVYGDLGPGLDVGTGAGPSAPFGYVVRGFGRDYRAGSGGQVPGTPVLEETRYGSRYTGSSYRDSYTEESAYTVGYTAGSGYGRDDDREDREGGDRDHRHHDRRDHDCGCRDDGPLPPPPPAHEPSPGPGYYGDLPPPDFVSPVAPPPHHNYRQEPGERG
jgi:hypothetical protein